mmetsp:Transcript_7409/g.18141  ORF Transcript_7409/g.18141 Transcript_7409/m.18141 type:complete len:244 (-) Transcript_7409:658-1389(-)
MECATKLSCNWKPGRPSRSIPIPFTSPSSAPNVSSGSFVSPRRSRRVFPLPASQRTNRRSARVDTFPSGRSSWKPAKRRNSPFCRPSIRFETKRSRFERKRSAPRTWRRRRKTPRGTRQLPPPERSTESANTVQRANEKNSRRQKGPKPKQRISQNIVSTLLFFGSVRLRIYRTLERIILNCGYFYPFKILLLFFLAVFRRSYSAAIPEQATRVDTFLPFILIHRILFFISRLQSSELQRHPS